MKALFIGVGSIGKRHIRDFYTECIKHSIEPEIHVLRRNVGELGNLAGIVSAQITELTDYDYDVIFITNPTNLHYDALQKCKGRTRRYFVEKPIFESCKYDIAKLGITDDNTYVAAPMRHTKTYKMLKDITFANNVFSARVICSSYLPQWRPNIDYRQNYSAHREMGGGVNLDLIHEIDYIYDLFGEPERFYVFSGKYSDLEITSDDLSVFIMKYSSMLCEVHLDYFGRKSVRACEVFTSEGSYIADFYQEKITCPTGKVIDCHVVANEEFIEEMSYFYKFLNGEVASINPPSLAFKILSIATKGVC